MLDNQDEEGGADKWNDPELAEGHHEDIGMGDKRTLHSVECHDAEMWRLLKKKCVYQQIGGI